MAVTCLDPNVGFDVYFVAEDKALDLSLNPAANRQTVPTLVRGVKPGSGPLGLLYPWADSFRNCMEICGEYHRRRVDRAVITFRRSRKQPLCEHVRRKGIVGMSEGGSLRGDSRECIQRRQFIRRCRARAHREPAGELAGNWTQLWKTTLLDLKTKSDASVDGWISVVSEKIPAGDYWTLRWRRGGIMLPLMGAEKSDDKDTSRLE